MGRTRKNNFTSPEHPEAERIANNTYKRLYDAGLNSKAIKKEMGPANYQLALNYVNRRKFFARQRKKAAEQAKAALPSGTAATQNEFNPDLELDNMLDKALGANNSYSYILPRLPALAVPRGSCSSATPRNSTGQQPPDTTRPPNDLSHLFNDPLTIDLLAAARAREARRSRVTAGCLQQRRTGGVAKRR